jgi:nucleotide-binding universal stress UspA family protein
MTQSQICPGPWKKLLVCTDGNSNSQPTVKKTLALARICGSTVFVLQVLQIVPEFEGVATELMVRLTEEARLQMEAIALQAARGGVILETSVLQSISLFGAILEEIERVQPDLVVMGRSAKSGLERLMLGSVTTRVIGLSPVNVLVVPLGATMGFSHLLIASDDSPCRAAVFRAALAIARQTHAQVIAISVVSHQKEIGPAEEILNNFGAKAQEYGVSLETRTLIGEPDEAIVEAAQKSGTELIIIGSHGRKGWKRLLMGSVAERVIGRVACPVLVVKKGSGIGLDNENAE